MKTMDKIERVKDHLIELMDEFYPDANWTIWINVWMDDTFKVICRSAATVEDGVVCRDFEWYENVISLKIYRGSNWESVLDEVVKDFVV